MMKFSKSLLIAGLMAFIFAVIMFSQKPTGEHADTAHKPPLMTESKTSNSRNLTGRRNHPLPAPLKKITTKELDHAALMREAKRLEKNKRTYRFAEAIPVKLTPSNSGAWTRQGDRAVWQLKINSPGASSLNLGFKQYHMPEGGELTIHRPGVPSPYRSFDHSDNEDHGELWTPLLSGENMMVSVSLPADKKSQLRLELSSINHGFRPVFSRSVMKNGNTKIGGDTSALCNIDAVCRSGDPNITETLGPILDFYQNQIRSVAAYTLNGTDTCSGALINNTANDKTPYFLTANHCGITTNNDSSAVFYFNFQNSYCRARSTLDSGEVGDGSLSQFMTGSTRRAKSSSSDFCLVELDDPIPASYDVFYAGWNRNNVAPTMAVGIHHPAVAEKRISVDVDSLGESDEDGGSSNTHFWKIISWDYGTTEGGSSGSPLFDSDGRIVGQLFGGDAACGNNLYDAYGKIFKSWTGNGTKSSRLRNWLDPSNGSITTLDGINHSPALAIENAELTEGNSGTADMIFTVTLSESSASSVTVDYLTSNDSATSGTDYTSSSGTVTFAIGETTKTITVPVAGDTTAEGDESFSLTLSNATEAIIRRSIATGKILTDDFSTPVLSGTTSANAIRDTTFSQQFTAINLPATFSLTGAHPIGLTIDETTGQVEWVPTATGSFSYTVKASNSAGSDTRAVNVNVTGSNNTASAAELDLTGVAFKMAGTSWVHQTPVNHDGTDALKSGNINHSEASSFSITVNGPGSVNFWLRVSSELNYDFAYFILNGDILVAESGSVNWAQHSFNLAPGPNTLSWLYLKDGTNVSGSDAAYLDEVTFSGYTAWTATHGIATAGRFSTDAEGDGAANGLEYATGLSPIVYDAQLLPQVMLDTDNLLRLTFSKPVGVTDVIYDAEVSEDLTGWTTVGRSILTNNGSTFDAKQTSSPAVDQKFMRLKVSPAP